MPIDNSDNRVSRRGLLQYSAGVISSAALVGITSAKPGDTEYVIARGGKNNEPRSVRNVPARWATHEQVIERVREKLAKKYKDHTGVLSVGLTPSAKSIRGHSFSKIEYRVRPGMSQRRLSNLPNNVTGIARSRSNLEVSSTATKEIETNLSLGDCASNKKTDTPFPGGYWIEHNTSNGTSIGTAGYAVWHTNDEKWYMLTANHVLTPGDCSLGDGREVQDINNNTIGYGSSIGNYGLDWILIDPTVDVSSAIYTGSRQAVSGWVTKDGCKWIRDQNKTVENYGSFTGHSSGEIKEIFSWATQGCVNMVDQGVKVSCRTGEGDSGGPIWFDNSDGKFIIGHNSFFPKNSSKSCTPLGSGKYGPYTKTFPFFRIANNNPVVVPDRAYSG